MEYTNDDKKILYKANSGEEVITLFKRSTIDNSASSINNNIDLSPIVQKSAVPEKPMPSVREIAKVVKENKIFQICCTHPFYTCLLLRRELVQRGWIEKKSYAIADKNSAKSKIPQILRTTKPNFIWTSSRSNKTHEEHDLPLYNRLKHRPMEVNFSCKLGLNNLNSIMSWFRDEDAVPAEVMPRSYILFDAAEKQAFSDDYRLTMCASFLLELLKLDLYEIFAPTGMHAIEIVNFAVQVVEKALANKFHNDLDDPEDVEPKTQQFDLYEVYNVIFKRIVRNRESIRVFDGAAAEKIIVHIECLMENAVKHFPHILNDGFHDLWILKPLSVKMGCGYGITVHNKESTVFKHCDHYPQVLYIVQKYVELPLLVYNTKFDIRQFFLIVMDDKCINVWMYKNCYLKFSGQEYNPANVWRAIHVTNHTVQRQYKNGARNKFLPSSNMWVLSEFKRYLEKMGEPDVWDKQIYPQLVDCIKSVLQGTMEGIEFEKNNFQLFGADVMITHDYHPLLIEINAAPDLSHSTIATKEVCGSIVKDILKVVIDFPQNKKCPTGDFERIYQLNLLKCCPDTNPTFEVKGFPCKIFSPQDEKLFPTKLSVQEAGDCGNTSTISCPEISSVNISPNQTKASEEFKKSTVKEKKKVKFSLKTSLNDYVVEKPKTESKLERIRKAFSNLNATIPNKMTERPKRRTKSRENELVYTSSSMLRNMKRTSKCSFVPEIKDIMHDYYRNNTNQSIKNNL